MSNQDSQAAQAENIFLSGSLSGLFARTALPIIFVMGMNGLQTVIDAYFVGEFVGSQALAAVTLMFPIFMLLVALSTLVANGMTSVIARQLGAGDMAGALNTLVSSQILALVVCGVLIAGFAVSGWWMVGKLADGSAPLTEMGYTYIAIQIWLSPLNFLLAIHGGALRSEGRVGFMAVSSLMVSLANIAFTYVLIAVLDRGVLGSAEGTVLAQLAALATILVYRGLGKSRLGIGWSSLTGGWHRKWLGDWSRFLALGAPQSLSFVGISLGTTAVILAVQIWNPDNYAATVAAYGIVLRLLTFTYLPLLGLSMAMQTLVGNNYGAAQWQRSNTGLTMALVISLVYGAVVQIIVLVFRHRLGFIFVDDTESAAEVARILPMTTAMYFAAGPILILSAYFQAIGDAGRSAIISLTRTYVFAIPLTFTLPFVFGEAGIWYAGPVAELAMIALSFILLIQTQMATGHRWGLFRHAEPAETAN
ncbi:MAG: MATE family efflux transporter [Salaquimonas sp.]|jgi:putative MATE family efflux protein|nr:MATE family efflux transporter [Salaquimonas sp.]